VWESARGSSRNAVVPGWLDLMEGATAVPSSRSRVFQGGERRFRRGLREKAGRVCGKGNGNKRCSVTKDYKIEERKKKYRNRIAV